MLLSPRAGLSHMKDSVVSALRASVETTGGAHLRYPARQGGEEHEAWDGAASLQNGLSARISLPPQTKERAPQAQTVMGYRVAVVGAAGNVGREMLKIPVHRYFP